MYLEVMTWPESAFDNHAIRGPVSKLARLAQLIERKLAEARQVRSSKVATSSRQNSSYSLVLDVQGDGFDPAKADRA